MGTATAGPPSRGNALGELELIAAIETALADRSGRLVRWTGDDAAVTRARPYAITSIDTLVDGVLDRLHGPITAMTTAGAHVSEACRVHDRRLAWLRRLWEFLRVRLDQRDDAVLGPVLRAADMTNRKTHEGGHNERPIAELLHEFRRERERFVARLDAWDESLVSLTALHPRLNQPLRVIDLAFFIAEHDDHHLTRMTELARQG